MLLSCALLFFTFSSLKLPLSAVTMLPERHSGEPFAGKTKGNSSYESDRGNAISLRENVATSSPDIENPSSIRLELRAISSKNTASKSLGSIAFLQVARPFL